MTNEFAPSTALKFEACRIHDVWAWNLHEELNSFLAAMAVTSVNGFIAIDTEFPGFVRCPPKDATLDIQYEALRGNVDLLRPIQLGVAIADRNGNVFGAWNFNFHFDVRTDHYAHNAIEFLRAAGLDFYRHATQGIDAASFGQRLASSLGAIRLADIDAHGAMHTNPCWVTFSGLHDLGYFLKVITSGRALPSSRGLFLKSLGAFCPRRCELKGMLPRYGSLEHWAAAFQVSRTGDAHNAASDALVTLRLFLRLCSIRQLVKIAALKCEICRHEAITERTTTTQMRETRSVCCTAAHAEMWGRAAEIAAR